MSCRTSAGSLRIEMFLSSIFYFYNGMYIMLYHVSRSHTILFAHSQPWCVGSLSCMSSLEAIKYIMRSLVFIV